MSDIKPDDLFLIHREGKDYKATVDQFAKDIHINVDACCEAPNDGKLTIKDDEDNVLGEFTANQEGDTEVVIPGGGGGGSLDCAGVVDCLNNAPVDSTSFAVAIYTVKDWYKDPSDQPENWPGNQNHAYTYANLCDSVTHEIIPFDQEGHGHSGFSGSILKLPHGYYHQTYCIVTASLPTSRLEDQEEVYEVRPSKLLLDDLKLFTGRYEKVTRTTTTEDLFTTGDEVENPLTEKNTVTLSLPRCDSLSSGECTSNDFENDGKYFFRLEFKYNLETFKIVLLMNHERQKSTTTTEVTSEMPNIKIQPMEDN